MCIALLSAAWSGWAIWQTTSVAEAAWTGGALIPVLSAEWAQPWRLLCAGWLHLDWAHALSNLPGLLIPGFAMARLMSNRAVVSVWGLGVLAGSLASMVFTQTWAVGASAGNAALASAVLCIAWWRWTSLNTGLRRLAVLGSVPWLVLLLMPRTGGVDHAAHLAGIGIGPVAMLLSRGAWAVGLVHIGALLAMLWSAARPPVPLITIPASTTPGCDGGLTDGLLVVCERYHNALGPHPNGVHHAWQVGDRVLLAPPGRRADRALEALRP